MDDFNLIAFIGKNEPFKNLLCDIVATNIKQHLLLHLHWELFCVHPNTGLVPAGS